MSIPKSLGRAKTFFVRAKELDKAKIDKADVMAYCCRRHGIKKALSDEKIKNGEGVLAYLGGVMDKLETEKVSLSEKYGADIMKDDVQLKNVKEFAMMIFKKADATYKAGKANSATAKSFYAAATYFEVAGDSDDINQAKKVSKFNATQIMKAIRAGETPLPPGGLKEEEPEQFEGGDDMPGGGGDYGFDAGLPAAPDIMPLPTAPGDRPDLPDAPDDEVEVVRGFNPDLPHGVYARDVSTFADVAPRLGELPPNAGLSLRGMQTLNLNRGHKKDREAAQAEKVTRDAGELFKKKDFTKGTEALCKAAYILQKRKPAVRVASGGLSENTLKDVLENVLYAARWLETAGQIESVANSKNNASQLINEAFSLIQRG